MASSVSRLGLLTALVTAAGLALAAFGPATFLYPPPGSGISGTASLWSEAAIGPAFGLFAAVAAAGGLAVAIGAALRVSGGGLWLVWLGLATLTVCAVVTLPGMSSMVTPSSLAATIPDSLGIGVYLVPAVLVGLLTAVVGAVTRPSMGSPTWT